MMRGVEVLRIKYGMMRKVARGLDVHYNTVRTWVKVPAEVVFKVAEIVGVEPEILRPDLFVNDPLRRDLITPEMVRLGNVVPLHRISRKSLYVTLNSSVNGGCPPANPLMWSEIENSVNLSLL